MLDHGNARRLPALPAAAIASAVLGSLGALAAPAGGPPMQRHPIVANYARPYEPPTLPAFIPLPPGAVEPTGWLRDWCLTARDGYTGHMDDVHEDFRKAWAADYKMTGDKLSYWWQGAWPYEGGGYWFDAMVRLGYALHDDTLIAKAKGRLEPVLGHRNADTILFMWWLNRNRAEDMAAAAKQDGGEAQEWPFWTNGFMGRTLAGYYAASGDQRAAETLQFAYSGSPDWIRKGFALTNPWPAYEAYTYTGAPTLKAALDELFARYPIETATSGKPARLYGGWYNRTPDETLPWYAQPDHGVHFNESTIPWALGYLWTGKRAYLDAPTRWYDVVERGDDGMQPYGVPVADENSGPTGSFRGTETCCVSSYMWAQLTLLGVGGQGRLADRVERAFFNAAPAVVSRDFRSHVYSQTPNRVGKGLPEGGQFAYQPTHWPLCCTASLNRMLPYYVGHMWMATYDNGLAATCYGPCKVTALAGDHVPVQLDCQTDYPFGEVIEVTVTPAREAAFALLFRVPGWCTRPTVTVNGRARRPDPDGRGFVRIERRWKPGDRVRLRFPMAVRVRSGHDNDAADTPYATVSYGPLLFALPIAEAGDANTPTPSAKWSYALDLSGKAPEAAVKVERRAMPDQWDWPLNAPLRLLVPVRSFEWKASTREAHPSGPAAPAEASPFQPKSILTMLPREPVTDAAAREVVALVPYGCTKLRVSMFPVTKRAASALHLNGSDRADTRR